MTTSRQDRPVTAVHPLPVRRPVAGPPVVERATDLDSVRVRRDAAGVRPLRGRARDPRWGRVLLPPAGSLRDPAGTSPEEAARLDAAVRSLGAEGDPVRIARVAAAGLALDRVAECREPLRRVVDALRRGPVVAAALTAFPVLCAGDVATGRWDEAVEIAAEGAALCERHGRPLPAASLRLGRALVAAARGEDPRPLVEPVLGRAAERGARTVVDEGRRVLALAALARGDAEDAHRHAVAVTAPGRLAGAAALRVSMDLVQSAVQLGRRDEAARHVRAMRECPAGAVSARFAMLTAASAALVAGPDAADGLFAGALDAPDADRWPFDQARIQLAHGEHLRRMRRTGECRVLLGAALDAFLRLRADPWAARAQGELRATGLTVGQPAGAGAPALSPDERAVAVLAAAGLTNKEIARRLTVSHHTVAARLYQVFPKLGVGSRTALRGAMRALDGGGPAPCRPASLAALG